MANNKDFGIKFSPKLVKVISEIEDDYDNLLAYEIMWITGTKTPYENSLGIYYLDVSDIDNCFNATIKGKKTTLSINRFAKAYFDDVDDKEILEFSVAYNKIKKGEVSVVGTPVEHQPFIYKPKDVRSTFLSMVTMTYPMGHEEEVLKFLPNLTEDIHGNYYKIIPGDEKTMFTSHLDTADRKQVPTNLLSKIIDGDEYIYTDGSSILGADDKSGVAVMLYMMAHNVPGLYYFFVGEERGGIGSRKLADVFDDTDYLKDIKRCISFDRRKTTSIITSQYGRECCSTEFGNALSREYSKGGLRLALDDTGIFTDSASFIDDISECTNISVGYNNEHTGKEIQNITYLEKLAKASINVDWKNLPSVRKVGINSEIVRKHKILINQVKRYVFGLEVKIVGKDDRVFIKLDLDSSDVKTINDTLNQVNNILDRYNVIDPYVVFEETYIKIELK
jgi:hypothetical protein